MIAFFSFDVAAQGQCSPFFLEPRPGHAQYVAPAAANPVPGPQPEFTPAIANDPNPLETADQAQADARDDDLVVVPVDLPDGDVAYLATSSNPALVEKASNGQLVATLPPPSIELSQPLLAELPPPPLPTQPPLAVFAGETLKEAVSRWAEDTDRSAVWKADIDYAIAANHQFDETLVDAFGRLMAQFPQLCGLPYANALVVTNRNPSDGACHAQ